MSEVLSSGREEGYAHHHRAILSCLIMDYKAELQHPSSTAVPGNRECFISTDRRDSLLRASGYVLTIPSTCPRPKIS